MARFQPTRPLRGATTTAGRMPTRSHISTHAPLAGRDSGTAEDAEAQGDFNPRAPCGARRGADQDLPRAYGISTHAPLAGRDEGTAQDRQRLGEFQPTRPLRGATGHGACVPAGLLYFNPRAPCGARRRCRPPWRPPYNFNPRAPCGARLELPFHSVGRSHFNPRAPCGARREAGPVLQVVVLISTHAPLAGRDTEQLRQLLDVHNFNPRAPCGARPDG